MGVGSVGFQKGRLPWPVFLALLLARETGRMVWREATIAWRLRRAP